MKHITGALALGVALSLLLLPTHAVAQATGSPFFNLTVQTGDTTQTFSDINWLPDTKGFGFGYENGPQTFTLPGGDTVQLSGYMNTDPYISYNISVTDFGAPSFFTFTFGTPIVPVIGANLVRASLSGSLSALGGNGAAFTPTGGPMAQTSSLSDGFGSVVVSSVNVGPAHSTGIVANGTYAYPTHQLGYGPLISGPVSGTGWTFMSTTLSFGLSGGNDGAALSGYFEIIPTPVPEPSSALLLLAGSLMVGTIISRSKRRR